MAATIQLPPDIEQRLRAESADPKSDAQVVIATSDIQAVADRIAREFDPEKIILFGSYAYGTPGPNSDVDLLVILPVAGKNWRKAAEIRNRVRSPFPMDLLVRAPEEMRQRLHVGDPFLSEIHRRGIVLHAKHHARMGG